MNLSLGIKEFFFKMNDDFMRGLLEVASTKYLFRGLAYSAENTISRQ